MKTVLLAVGDCPSTAYLQGRVRALAEEMLAKLHIYRALYDPMEEMDEYVGFDNFSLIKKMLLKEERKRIEDLVHSAVKVSANHSMSRTAGGMEKSIHCVVEWCKRAPGGILAYAKHINADLIVVERTKHSRLKALVHTPDDWNLLRHAECPILMLSPFEHSVRAVVAAVNIMNVSESHSKLTARVLENAAVLAEAFGVSLNVVSVLPISRFGIPTASRIAVGDHLLATLEGKALNNLEKILTGLGINADEHQVVAGVVEEELASKAEEAGLLVIGSVAREGLSGKRLGNTSERVLYQVQSDVLVVN
ncbi:MAG: universal stress protein [Porticoccus sp.]|nr:universal stress protein [Porticoccus sp.]MBQ0806432.1 universal stress protein [Porticoccus sp.]